ncbi:MAG: primosomal protein N' [Candidatus Borkfalkiaceae bacterium]|nr:primosomal protein N' [Christensenellaceae bacterium]
MIAKVIVDVAHSEVDRVFDYISIDGVNEGDRVLVPFGRQTIEGFVVGFSSASDLPYEKLKAIVKRLDDFSALSEETLKLAEFLRDTYHVPFALALRQFIPSELRGGKVKEKTVLIVTLSDIPIEEMISSLKKSATAQIGIIETLAKTKRTGYTELSEKFGSSAIRTLEKRGFLTVTEEKSGRTPYTSLENSAKDVKLTPEQARAVYGIENTDKRTSLLFGVTGSGKTEVYLKLISDTLKNGKTAIMLVPEISLTPQMLRQLRARFQGEVSILHSKLSAGEKFDEWLRLKRGEAKIAIGARSAIFAPLDNLGLIVIDEEHDGSYEAENSPRYKTIEVAEERARLSGAKIVLGSATPSVESYDKAIGGEYYLAEMKTRINGKNLPEFIVADMRQEIRRGNESIFSSDLKSEIEDCLKQGNQAIIFFNRRGYSRQVLCRDCGNVIRCENCDVALNYHKDQGVLKCHFCNATYKMPSACPECGSINLSYNGIGTQKVVDEIKRLFPSARLLRMDNDTTSGKEGHFKILKDFAEKKADILVGTQMVAKGHDFPAVTLVGILDADMSLYFSDYRSGERTYQLITQVAGRSGRADKKGKVVLQTYNPDNEVLRFAINYDYVGFFEREKAVRKSTNFPPYSLVLRIMVEADDDKNAMEGLKEVYFRVKEVYDRERDKFTFFNKMKCPVKRIKNKYRYEILMRIPPDDKRLKDEIYNLALKDKKPGVLTYVEENPSNLY